MPTHNPSLPQGYLLGDNGQIIKADDAAYQTASQSDPNARAYAIIDADPNLTPEQKDLAKATVGAYSGGIEADAPAILRTFEQLKQTTIDPHFNDLIAQATYGLKQNVAALEAQRAHDLEVQNVNAAEAVRNEQKSLEASGMLNTGEAVRKLGEQAPQVPFGGEKVEGLIPQSNRLIATDTQQRYQENLRGQYNAAEQALGTAGVVGIVPSGSTIGGVTGTIPTARTQEYGQTLSNIAANEEAKRGLTAARPNPVAPITVK